MKVPRGRTLSRRVIPAERFRFVRHVGYRVSVMRSAARNFAPPGKATLITNYRSSGFDSAWPGHVKHVRRIPENDRLPTSFRLDVVALFAGLIGTVISSPCRIPIPVSSCARLKDDRAGDS
jgi:hypothetical protein